MSGYLEIDLRGEVFFLLPEKALYRPTEKQLIICDLHLGKTMHFRKQGIALPADGHMRDLKAMQNLIHTWKPECVMILGDLFHSDYNKEWLWFQSLLIDFMDLQFILVEGNHDILQEKDYEMPNLLKSWLIEEEQFIFSHYPMESKNKLNICGHVHPGIRLQGKAKESVSFPCFYLNKTHFILPAFGDLTGLKLLEKEENANYYLVAGERVVRL